MLTPSAPGSHGIALRTPHVAAHSAKPCRRPARALSSQRKTCREGARRGAAGHWPRPTSRRRGRHELRGGPAQPCRYVNRRCPRWTRATAAGTRHDKSRWLHKEVSGSWIVRWAHRRSRPTVGFRAGRPTRDGIPNPPDISGCQPRRACLPFRAGPKFVSRRCFLGYVASSSQAPHLGRQAYWRSCIRHHCARHGPDRKAGSGPDLPHADRGGRASPSTRVGFISSELVLFHGRVVPDRGPVPTPVPTR